LFCLKNPPITAPMFEQRAIHWERCAKDGD
jgi:hypothetical protein